ncbi:Hemin import ATP-binding protein HmuV [Sterolibacterium denitrificans]|uniref:Hemin import ATP-binding protein HmuV n=1 Tax=Sterolibacterium denitrificans TaxID=157592 RepID=A0A7Z7MTV2_9PROT|nr:ABC transporter ATP-binding protein [Sterolibacterium denitrificans]SMB21069.1 Hemin import ATP-binding protein HmuV [Sterolibacterium denitrificans]
MSGMDNVSASAASPALLQARELSVSIGLHKVCLGLDFELPPGSCLGILGRNGAGKSTLLSTLAGLRPADAGTLRLAGKTYAELGLRAAARLRGWLGQDRHDPFASSVLDSVLSGRHPHLDRWSWESAGDTAIAHAALAATGLTGMAEREIHTLSGGERQRVAIATLLAQEPRVYLLDEPLAHLDLNHQIATLELFSRRARDTGAAVIMVLHDPGFVLRYCDQALLLFGDSRYLVGPVEQVLDETTLTSLYGHPLRRVENAFIPQ